MYSIFPESEPLPPQEIHCPACVGLGHEKPRLAFIIHGRTVILGGEIVYIQFRCQRCKSVVKWGIGTDKFEIVRQGVKINKRQKAVFE